MRKEILAIIPARGGSKGILNKNIIDFCGRPLIDYTFEAAEKSEYLTRIILSTDSMKIANTVKSDKIETRMRPQELSGDTSTTAEVLSYLLTELAKENYQPDYIVILQPTSPLRTSDDIDNCLQILLADDKIDSVVSVQKVPHSCIPQKIMKLVDGKLIPFDSESNKYTTRQAVPEYYARNGAAVYAFKTSVFLETMSYYGNCCVPYLMSKTHSIDIDDMEDLLLARLIMEYEKM